MTLPSAPDWRAPGQTSRDDQHLSTTRGRTNPRERPKAATTFAALGERTKRARMSHPPSLRPATCSPTTRMLVAVLSDGLLMGAQWGQNRIERRRMSHPHPLCPLSAFNQRDRYCDETSRERERGNPVTVRALMPGSPLSRAFAGMTRDETRDGAWQGEGWGGGSSGGFALGLPIVPPCSEPSRPGP